MPAAFGGRRDAGWCGLNWRPIQERGSLQVGSWCLENGRVVARSSLYPGHPPGSVHLAWRETSRGQK